MEVLLVLTIIVELMVVELLVFVSRQDYNLPPIIGEGLFTEELFVDVDGQWCVQGLVAVLIWCVDKDYDHDFDEWLVLNEEAIMCLFCINQSLIP